MLVWSFVLVEYIGNDYEQMNAVWKAYQIQMDFNWEN